MQARFHQEKGRAGGGAEHAGSCAGENVHPEGLDVGVFEDGGCDAFSKGFVEA